MDSKISFIEDKELEELRWRYNQIMENDEYNKLPKPIRQVLEESDVFEDSLDNCEWAMEFLKTNEQNDVRSSTPIYEYDNTRMDQSLINSMMNLQMNNYIPRDDKNRVQYCDRRESGNHLFKNTVGDGRRIFEESAFSFMPNQRKNDNNLRGLDKTINRNVNTNKYLPENMWQEPRLTIEQIERIRGDHYNRSNETKIEIDHIRTFNGLGEDLQVAHQLETLLSELQKCFKDNRITENRKIIYLKRKLGDKPLEQVQRQDPKTFNDAAGFLRESYSPNLTFENAQYNLKRLQKEEGENFNDFQSRAKIYANQIANEYGLSLNSKILFPALAESLLHHFPDSVTTDSKVIEARVSRDIDELINYIRMVIKDNPSLWYKEKKDMHKSVKFANIDNLEPIKFTEDVLLMQNNDNSKVKQIINSKIDKNQCQNQQKDDNCKTTLNDQVCNYCNLRGHLFEHCQIKFNYDNYNQHFNMSNIQTNFLTEQKCKFCGSISHKEMNCWKKYPQLAPNWRQPSKYQNSNHQTENYYYNKQNYRNPRYNYREMNNRAPTYTQPTNNYNNPQRSNNNQRYNNQFRKDF